MNRPQRLNVAFDAGHLLERGTDVALFDYALGNEELLGNRSFILCPARATVSALDKFRSRFTVLLYRDRDDLRLWLEPMDVYYVQDHGKRPPWEVPSPPHGRTVVHCVFECKEPHGDVYAAISSWVALHRGLDGGQPCPVVPYMVWLPQVEGDLRRELGIPAQATVLGRHGGASTFDLPFVHAEVRAAVLARQDLWFVFLNTGRSANRTRGSSIYRRPSISFARRSSSRPAMRCCTRGTRARRSGSRAPSSRSGTSR